MQKHDTTRFNKS